jgi:predicted RNase H-like nuclease (RuvC/YqgF family)
MKSRSEPSLDQRLNEAKRQSMTAQSELQERNRSIVELRRDLQGQSARLKQLKQQRQQLQSDLRDSESGRQRLSVEESDLANKNQIAGAEIATFEEKLHSAEMQASEQSARVSSLQSHVSELQQSLDDKNQMVDEQQELLAHDRDIRELMGARDLYIAEVYDVEKNGQTRKAFGRVFYTKGKSLVFYAYDLDQQKTLKNASTFQAWGRRGSDRAQALSLGIFYEDNASKKRWILKTADPKVLVQVDAVFVTVEPNGGSSKPSTRTILFAYLDTAANHP